MPSPRTIFLAIFGAAVLSLMVPVMARADFGVTVPMSRSNSGSFDVEATFGKGLSATFLVDTGASLTTISKTLFRSLELAGHNRPIRRVAARLANGRVQAMDVYRIADFRLGEHCLIGAIEVAVIGTDGRNILGMNALAKAAPFGLDLKPPTLLLSECGGDRELAETL